MIGSDDTETPIEVPAMESSIMALISDNPLPHPLLWFKFRFDSPASFEVLHTLFDLENEGKLEYFSSGIWGKKKRFISVEDGFDPMKLVGPVWEPRVVEALRGKGLQVIQQKHVLSYYLDIAIVTPNDILLNVEVDGCTHRRCDGRRRTSDLIRDSRLRALGWTVCRIWVRDLISDFDAQIERVVRIWNDLTATEVPNE